MMFWAITLIIYLIVCYSVNSHRELRLEEHLIQKYDENVFVINNKYQVHLFKNVQKIDDTGQVHIIGEIDVNFTANFFAIKNVGIVCGKLTLSCADEAYGISQENSDGQIALTLGGRDFCLDERQLQENSPFPTLVPTIVPPYQYLISQLTGQTVIYEVSTTTMALGYFTVRFFEYVQLNVVVQNRFIGIAYFDANDITNSGITNTFTFAANHTEGFIARIRLTCSTRSVVGGSTPLVASEDIFEVIAQGPEYCPLTEVPTKKPTRLPSQRPSKAPTFAPSRTPTKVPSFTPSKTPSAPPSRSPTKDPSFRPSHSPTAVPSKGPTRFPSAMPSKAPTATPTIKPSGRPSVLPSKMPSMEPTPLANAPTRLPSRLPTFRPSTVHPSDAPTPPPAEATGVPTSTPIVTVAPTEDPTELPSPPPTVAPSPSPTHTHGPTQRPVGPSAAPTRLPTPVPSVKPTTSRPSRRPTGPSRAPTRAPTRIPTVKPTTRKPSRAPTRQPTKAPTKQPVTQVTPVQVFSTLPTSPSLSTPAGRLRRG